MLGGPSFQNNFNHFLAATCHLQVTRIRYTNLVRHGESVDHSVVPLKCEKILELCRNL